MTSFSQKRAPKARKHWTQKAHESTVRRDGNNQFHLEIEGGASQGLFPIIISVEQSKVLILILESVCCGIFESANRLRLERRELL